MKVLVYDNRGREIDDFKLNHKSGGVVEIKKSRSSLELNDDGGIIRKCFHEEDVFFLIALEKKTILISRLSNISINNPPESVKDDGWVYFLGGSSVNAFSGSSSLLSSNNEKFLFKFDDSVFFPGCMQNSLVL